MKDQILELLRREPGYLSGQEMSNRLGVSRAAVWKAVEALRKEGYTIDSAPNRGYRLNAPTGRLSLREISARLEDHPWASLVQVLDCVDSTNNLAKTLAAQGAPARDRCHRRTSDRWSRPVGPGLLLPPGDGGVSVGHSPPGCSTGTADASHLRRGRGAVRRRRGRLRPPAWDQVDQ